MKNKFKIKPKAPMLIYRTIAPQIETKERMAIQMLASGHGNEAHYHLLQDVFNLLYVASEAPGREHLKSAIPVFKKSLESMKNRFEKFGKFGLDYSDKKTLTDMINLSADFWLRQPTEFYMICDAEVRKFYSEVLENA